MFATNFEDLMDDDVQQDPRNANGRREGDDRLHVLFYKKPIKNGANSIAEGRPIYDEVDFIKITIPGDQYNTIDNFASDEYKARFPNEWKSYTNKQSTRLVGTPLEHWKGVNLAQVAEFKSFNVFTVEELIDLPDSYASKFMGIIALKAKAKHFIEASKEEAISTKAAETNSRLKELEQERNTKSAEVEELKQQMKELMAGFAAKAESAKATKKTSE